MDSGRVFGVSGLINFIFDIHLPIRGVSKIAAGSFLSEIHRDCKIWGKIPVTNPLYFG